MAEACRPSVSEINQMNKETLKKNSLRSSYRERDALKADILKLKTDNTILTETLAQHQRFLEYIDSDKRACNLIITGVPEEDDL